MMINDVLKNVLLNKTRLYRILSIGGLFVMTVFMIRYASAQSFWIDELWAIGTIANNNVFHILKVELLQNSPYNLPLYTLILKVFYEVMPYGELYMYITSICFVVLGCILLAKAGKEIGGEDIGFIAFCLAVTSSTLIYQGGWQIRPYGITFCFSALTLLSYAKRLKQESTKHIVLYGISVLFFLYTHWFASILMVFFVLVDVCLFLMKRIQLKCVISYIIAGVFFAPWFVLMIIYHNDNLGEYWAGIPAFAGIKEAVKYLLSHNSWSILFFKTGMIFLAVQTIQKLIKNEKVDWLWHHIFFSIFWVIGFAFFYSHFINPKGSVFVYRYFLCIMPQAMLIAAFGVEKLLNLNVFVNGKMFPKVVINNVAIDKTIVRLALIGILFMMLFTNYNNVKFQRASIRDPYREAAEYITSDSESRLDDSLVLLPSYAQRGWIEYYFKKRGFTLPRNMANGYTFPLQYSIKDSVEINSETISSENILNYKKLYIFNRNGSFLNNFRDFLDTHYEVESKHYADMFIIYRKKPDDRQL